MGRSTKTWWPALLLGALFAVGYVWLTYTFFTSRWLGGNDLFVVWRAIRAWVVEGQDPYGAAVTRAIQLEMLGRPAAPGEHQFGFAYPLGIALFIVPLLPFPFPLARAIWMVLLQGLMVLFVVTTVWPRRPRPVELSALVIAALFFYPTARAIILGQPAVVVAAAVAVTLWALRAGRGGTAGAALALTTLKPQMIFLFVPAALLWAWRAGRRAVWWGFGVSFLLLNAVPALWFPAWPLSFLAAVRDYAGYTRLVQDAPLMIVGAGLGPQGASALLAGGLLVAIGWLAYLFLTTLPDDAEAVEHFLLWALVLTMWTAWRTATTNQIVALLPLLAWRRAGLSARAFWGAMLAFLAVPWWVFLATVVGDSEQPAAYVPVPVLALAVLLLFRFRRREHGGTSRVEPAPQMTARAEE